MTRPDLRQPGVILCIHCGEYEAKVACRRCRYLVCGECALDGSCPEEYERPDRGERPAEERARLWVDGVGIDHGGGTIHCDGEVARIADVIEVIVEGGFSGWGELHYEYRVRVVLGDRRKDFLAVQVRSRNPMRDLDQMVLAHGQQLARALGVRLRVERSPR